MEQVVRTQVDLELLLVMALVIIRMVIRLKSREAPLLSMCFLAEKMLRSKVMRAAVVAVKRMMMNLLMS